MLKDSFDLKLKKPRDQVIFPRVIHNVSRKQGHEMASKIAELIYRFRLYFFTFDVSKIF